MATTMSLAELRTAVLQRIDRLQNQNVPSPFFTTQELNSYINQSYFELYDLLVQKYGDDYYIKTPFTLIATDGINYLYDLPDDFYKLAGLDLLLANSINSAVTILPFMRGDRNRYSVPNFQSFYGVTNLRYRLNGGKLWLTPIPAANQTIQMIYIPKMTTLVADGDLVDGISGWTEYIIVDCAIKCLTKEESDASVFVMQKEALIQRIESVAGGRDAGNPPTVLDVQYQEMNFPGGNGAGYGAW